MYIGQNELYDQVGRLACSTLGLNDRVLVDGPSPTNGFEIERGRGHRLMLLPHMFDALSMSASTYLPA